MTNQPLDYASPTKVIPVPWIPSLLTPLVPLIAATSGAATAVLYAVPKLEFHFRNLKIELPPITQYLLAIARWFANDFGWTLVMASIVVIAFIRVLIARGSSLPAVRTILWRNWIIIASFLLIVALAFTLIATTSAIDRFDRLIFRF